MASSRTGVIRIEPAFADVTLKNTEQEKKVTYRFENTSSKEVTLEIGTLDFNVSENGIPTFIGQESGSFSYSLASFLQTEANTLTLDAGERRSFTVTIKNRPDLSPGGHYAAIVARVKNTEESPNNARIEPAVSGMILLRKTGGERFNLSLVHSEWPDTFISFSFPKSITLTFQNEGNVHLVPYGTLEIRDLFGRVTHKGTLNSSSLRVFPETRRYITADLNTVKWPLPIMLDTLTIRGDDSLHKAPYTYREGFLYIDPIWLLCTLVIFLIVWTQMRKRKNKK